MNQGERDELIIQLKLLELKQRQIIIEGLGKIVSLKLFSEYNNLPSGINMFNLNFYTDTQLEILAKQCGIIKAGKGYKADTIINGEPISLKSLNYSPPALVNHTTRPGFEIAAIHSGGQINLLDEIIEEYWKLRFSKKIGEDISNSNNYSPFRNQKNTLKPFLNFFLFKGTGSGLSNLSANRILSFSDPLDYKTWILYDQSNAVDLYWDGLIFSLRAKKGMPNGYPNNMSQKLIKVKPSIDKWTNFIDGDYRGALHIRYK